MTFKVSYHPEALAEFRADVELYEARGIGLGDRFESSVDDVLDALVEWPGSGAVWPSWDSIPVIRSRRVADFAYRLVYLV